MCQEISTRVGDTVSQSYSVVKINYYLTNLDSWLQVRFLQPQKLKITKEMGLTVQVVHVLVGDPGVNHHSHDVSFHVSL